MARSEASVTCLPRHATPENRLVLRGATNRPMPRPPGAAPNAARSLRQTRGCGMQAGQTQPASEVRRATHARRGHGGQHGAIAPIAGGTASATRTMPRMPIGSMHRRRCVRELVGEPCGAAPRAQRSSAGASARTSAERFGRFTPVRSAATTVTHQNRLPAACAQAAWGAQPSVCASRDGLPIAPTTPGTCVARSRKPEECSNVIRQAALMSSGMRRTSASGGMAAHRSRLGLGHNACMHGRHPDLGDAQGRTA